MAADVRFRVRRHVAVSPQRLWEELIDWESHGRWIPATRVEPGDGDPSRAGSTFTAWTGRGPLTLEDRMRVERCEWDERAASGACEVEKLGPVLRGRAGFAVVSADGGAVVDWFEDVRVPWVPGVLARPVAWVSAAGFRLAIRRLSKLLAT